MPRRKKSTSNVKFHSKRLARNASRKADPVRNRHLYSFTKVLEEHFGDSCTTLVGAEVGVYLGQFSEGLLERFPHLLLYLVDPYPLDTANWGDFLSRAKLDWKPENMTSVKESAAERLQRFVDAKRAVWVYAGAHEVSMDMFLDLNFAFLDHNHSLAAMRRDLPIWWEGIRSGGLLAGHDWKEGQVRWGVTRAVTEFAAKLGLPIETTTGKVWVVKKPQTYASP